MKYHCISIATCSKTDCSVMISIILFLHFSDYGYGLRNPAEIPRGPEITTQPDSIIVRRFFFYFLVYGSSDPNFCILEKKKKIFLTFFFIFSDVKKLPDLKKNILKKITKIV